MGSKLRICRACLSTEVALFNIHKNDLANVFEQFAGVTVNISDGFPPYLCMLCIRLLQRYSGYRLKTQLANEVLKKIINKNSDKKIKHLQKINFLNLQTTNVNVISYIPDNSHVDIIEETISSIDEETRSCFEVKTLDEELINEEYDVTDFNSENSKTISSARTDDDKLHDGLVYDEITPIFVIADIKNDCESVNGEETVCKELSCDEKVKSKNGRKAKSPKFTEDDKSQSYNGYSETSDEDLINEEYDETDFRSQNRNSMDTINLSCTDDKKTRNGLVNDNFFAINNIKNKNVTVNGEEIVSDELSCEESVQKETECDKTDVESENDWKTESATRNEREKSQSDKGHSKISSISAIEGIYNKNVIVIGGGNVGEELFSEGSAQKDVENSETKVVTDINKEVATSTVDGTTKVAISVIRNMIVIDGEKNSERMFSESKVKKKKIRKRAPKRNKDDPMSERLPDDFEIDDKYKTATLCFTYRPTHVITRGHMEKRLQDLEQFSKIYRVNIKFMSKEEQLAVLHERTKLYKDCPYRCKLCLIGFRNLELYNSHVMKAHDPARGDYACDVCGNRFKSSKLKVKHVNLAHLKRFTCQLCGKVTKSQSFAKAHHALHKDSTTDEIPKNERWRYKYDPKPIKCPICKDNYLGKLGVAKHARSAHRQMVTCSDCGAHFENKNLLVKHLGDRCSPDDSPCPMCGVNFSSDTLMMKHFEDTHRGFYKSGHCSKTFTGEHGLSMHWNNTHSGKQRPDTTNNTYESYPTYICEHCGKSFKGKQRFVSHTRVHTGEKPYKCPQCLKTFSHAGTLRVHVLMHKDERPFKCSECPRAFRQSIHRKQHMRTHTLEKPYSCSVCQKRFSIGTNLKEHVQTVHEGLPPRPRRRKKH